MDNKPQRPTPDSNIDLRESPGAELSNDPGSDCLITIQIDPDYEALLDADRLHKLAIAVLKAEGVQGPLELGVVIASDEEVHTLNRDYLGHDFDTDVLSFGMSERGEGSAAKPNFVSPPGRPSYLGDIAISYQRAAEQAPEYGHNADAEVAMLLIHGLLHLLGYDDLEESTREKMHARQEELLNTLYHAA